MKLTKNHLFTIIILVIVAIVRGPQILNNFSVQGEILPSKEFIQLSLNETPRRVSFPPKNEKAMAIFWATWCAPCHLEMNRLKSSVENGKISSQKIFAINPFESEKEVIQFLKKTPYPFIFINDQEIATKLKIQLTPTTLFVENEEVTSLSSGLSLWGIWKAEFTL